MKNAHIYKTGLLLAACLALFICSSAQEFTVKGRLVDSASAKPVPYATINFLQPQKKFSKTVISDKSGTFQTSLPPGPYKVTITHSSFRKKGMHLSVEGKHADMGTMQLVTMVKNLNEVTVI